MTLWIVTNSTSNGLPARTSYNSVAPPAWLCVSVKPGTMVIPLASNVRVRMPTRARMSVLLPMAANRAPRDREPLRARQRAVYRVDPGVEDDEIGVDGRERIQRPGERAGSARRDEAHEFAACRFMAHSGDADGTITHLRLRERRALLM